jgi:hypothetical protein
VCGSKYASGFPTSQQWQHEQPDMLQPTTMLSISFNASGPLLMAGPSTLPNNLNAPPNYEWGGSMTRMSPSLQYSPSEIALQDLNLDFFMIT